MSYHYSDPTRENDVHALPDVWVTTLETEESPTDDEGTHMGAGWYWSYCFPGCMPDSDWYGPFETEDEAVADMRKAAERYGD